MSAVEQLYATDMIEIVLDLPVPPSTNKMRRGGGGPAARWRKAFYKHADGVLQATRPRDPLKAKRLLGRYEATIQINERLSRVDLDNHVKALLDYVVSREFVPDDSPRYLRRLVVEWGCPVNGARVTLRSVQQ